MVHERQRLALGFEPGQDFARVHPGFNDLERDAAAHGFLLLRHIDHTAAAFADLLEELVTADAVGRFLS
jgi:hypothetical protein